MRQTFNPFDLWLRLLQGPDTEIPTSRELFPGVVLTAHNWHAEPSPTIIILRVDGQERGVAFARDASTLDPRDVLIEDLNARIMVLEALYEDAIEPDEPVDE